MLQISPILHLFLRGKCKELLPNGKLLIDFLLRQPEASDVEEADLMNGLLELVRESFFAPWSVKLGEVECDEVGPFDWLEVNMREGSAC
jgi:hypothetical protein